MVRTIDFFLSLVQLVLGTLRATAADPILPHALVQAISVPLCIESRALTVWWSLPPRTHHGAHHSPFQLRESTRRPRRFVKDGEVPVVALNGSREHGAEAVIPSNRLAVAKSALEAEPGACERATCGRRRSRRIDMATGIPRRRGRGTARRRARSRPAPASTCAATPRAS